MNNDNFLIERDYIIDAQNLCRYINNSTVRGRAVANSVAANIAAEYFREVEADTESGLHNIPFVLEDLEISDIYIKGNYIDVRIYFSEDEIFVPKVHYDFGITPIAYMFIKLDEDLSSGSVSGFVLQENIDTSEEYNGYYRVNEGQFSSYYDIDAVLSEHEDEESPISLEKDIFDYLDGVISDKQSLYKLLTTSKYARETLAAAASVKNILSEVKFEDISENTDVPSEMQKPEEQLSEGNMQEPNIMDISTGEIETLDEISSDAVDLLESSETDELLINYDAHDDMIDLSSDDTDITPIDGDEDSLIEEDITSDDNILDIAAEESLIENETVALDITDEDKYANANMLDVQQENDNLLDFAEDLPEVGIEEPKHEIMIDDSIESESISELDEQISDVPEQGFMPENSEENEPDEDTEFSSLSEFDYSTEVTPSINTIEGIDEGEKIAESAENFDDSPVLDVVDDMPESSEGDNGDEVEGVEYIESEPVENIENNEHIDVLFQKENNDKTEVPIRKRKSPLPILGALVLIAGLGYFGYTKFYQNSSVPEPVAENNMNIETAQSEQKSEEIVEPAMPVETVENIETPKIENEGTSISIPAIEQNLDASIDVSNMTINWEVPASYAANATAKRYFVRVGKIMQLNLKTELLLLSTPPITNKISLELEFNNDSNKFKVKSIVDSSGVPGIDKVVKETAEKTLNINLNINMSIFSNLQGNPKLVINL